MGVRWAENLINLMVQDGMVAPEHRQRLKEIWALRNAAVHGGHRSDSGPDAVTVEKMIDGIESICASWEQRPRKRTRG